MPDCPECGERAWRRTREEWVCANQHVHRELATTDTEAVVTLLRLDQPKRRFRRRKA